MPISPLGHIGNNRQSRYTKQSKGNLLTPVHSTNLLTRKIRCIHPDQISGVYILNVRVDPNFSFVLQRGSLIYLDAAVTLTPQANHVSAAEHGEA